MSEKHIPVAIARADCNLVFYAHTNNAERLKDLHLRVVAVNFSADNMMYLDFIAGLPAKIEITILGETDSALKDILREKTKRFSAVELADFNRKLEETTTWIWFNGVPENESLEWREELVGRMMREDTMGGG